MAKSGLENLSNDDICQWLTDHDADEKDVKIVRGKFCKVLEH